MLQSFSYHGYSSYPFPGGAEGGELTGVEEEDVSSEVEGSKVVVVVAGVKVVAQVVEQVRPRCPGRSWTTS